MDEKASSPERCKDRGHPATRLWGLGLVLAVMLALIGHLLWSGYGDALQAAERNAAGLATLYESHLNTSLRRADSVLRELSQELRPHYESAALQEQSRNAWASLIARHLHGFDEIAGICLIDAQGVLRYASDSRQGGIDVADRDYFLALRDRPEAGTFVSQVLTARTTGRTTVMLARSVINRSGGFLGIVGVTLNLDFLEKLLATTSLGPEGFLAIRRSDDSRLVARHPGGSQAPNSPDLQHPVQQLVAAGVAYGTTLADGHILGFRKLEAYPWYVVVGVSRRDASADWLVRVYLAAGLLLIMGGVTLVLLRDLGRAHREITDFADEMTKLSQVVEQTPHSILITDLEGRIEYVNRGFTEHTGYTAAEMIGRDPSLLKSGLTPKPVFEQLWKHLKQGRNWQGEFINRSRDGKLQTHIAHVLPIRQVDGRVTHYVSIQEDITEKKQQAEELNRYRLHLEDLVAERTRQLLDAKSAAEAASRAKSSFLSNMSHEIRTPMNAIIGFTHRLRKESGASRSEEYLDKISAAAQHLLGIINDILDISKIEAGKLVLEETDLSLLSVFGNVTSLVEQKAKEKGLQIVYSLGPGIPACVQGDPLRLGQALLNFATNAVKFSEHGVIEMRARSVSASNGRMLVRFEVEDQGVGIAPADSGRLFQAFEQADSSITRRHGGTGLGLAICRHLALAMGGDIGVDSEPGRGSTFWFTAWLGCRCRQTDAGRHERLDEESTGAEYALLREHAGRRILVVEDNAINQEIIRELLGDVGLAVDTADNGRIAVDRVRRHSYDLILMDMQMPEMDGLEATRLILRLPGRGTIPIIALTANTFAEDQERCLEAGMVAYLGKPVEPDELFAAIRRWLPRDRQAASPAAEPSV